jgi:hypothetical protein
VPANTKNMLMSFHSVPAMHTHVGGKKQSHSKDLCSSKMTLSVTDIICVAFHLWHALLLIESKYYSTDQVIIISMENKGKNKKPILKSCVYPNDCNHKRYHSTDVSVCHHTATSQFIWSPQVVCIFINIQLDMVKHSITDQPIL